MKSRGAYETLGTIGGLTAIESITLDREVAHLKDSLMPKYAELIYNGFWWSPEREMLQVAIDHSQEYVSGDVRLKLFKGNVDVGRRSPHGLRRENRHLRRRWRHLPQAGGRLHQAERPAASESRPQKARRAHPVAQPV